MSAPEYTQDYVTDETDTARQVHAQVDHHGTDFDPGNGGAYPANWGGMPAIPGDQYGQAAQLIPQTFEDANPALSYTRPAPRHVSYVRSQPARSHKTRNYLVPFVGDPIMILGSNPQRWKTILSAAALGIFISDDPAALQGLSATNSGNGFPLPLSFIYESTSELFAMAVTAPIILGIFDYIDN